MYSHLRTIYTFKMYLDITCYFNKHPMTMLNERIRERVRVSERHWTGRKRMNIVEPTTTLIPKNNRGGKREQNEGIQYDLVVVGLTRFIKCDSSSNWKILCEYELKRCIILSYELWPMCIVVMYLESTIFLYLMPSCKYAQCILFGCGKYDLSVP